jgi:hypothetical protein
VTFTLQGRPIGPSELALIGQLLQEHPDWSRRRLSHALCERWNWRNAAGQLKDMASRTLLLKLEQRGYLRLPARRRKAFNRMRQGGLVRPAWDQTPRSGRLSDLGALRLEEVSSDRGVRQEVRAALGEFHYLGFGGTVGENLQYVVRDAQGRLLVCLVFGSAAWKCQARDRFIGWEPEQRERHLSFLTNNTRFLILPWVQVRHLASWSLSGVLRRLSQDWQTKYGHPIYLVETFVERDRFGGTAYQAANWIAVGSTTGRTRQDRDRLLQQPIKEIYVYPLHRNFRQELAR